MTTYAPRHCDIWPWTKPYSTVGTWVRLNGSTNLGMGVYYTTSAAQNDEIVWQVPMDAGTWTLTKIGSTDSVDGIITWYLDATSLGTQDWYSASSVGNVVKQIVGFTVATPGVYSLKAKVETKHASASAYRMVFNLITLTRTGA